VLQCVAVCCSVLQCVAVCCSVLQCVAVCCSVLQCVAVCCSITDVDTVRQTWEPPIHSAVSVLQCVAMCCSVLQCVTVCCNVLRCVAVCCSVLQCESKAKRQVCKLSDAIFDFNYFEYCKCEVLLPCDVHRVTNNDTAGQQGGARSATIHMVCVAT